MNRNFNRVVAGALATATALAATAGAAEARTFKGTVVHHNHRAHSFVVADRAGRLFAVHAAHSPRIGSQILVTASPLRDGTFKLQRERRAGRAARRVRIRGVVSYVTRRNGEFTLSADGVSMLVVPAHRRGPRAAEATPSVGDEVVATGTIDDHGDLEDQAVQDVGTATNGVKLEGIILAIDPTARTITVSGDDEDQSGASVTVSVPANLDISQFSQGEEVELQVQPTGPGAATLLGSADDESAQSADDQTEMQGENPGTDDQGEDSRSQTTGSTDGSPEGGSSSSLPGTGAAGGQHDD